LATKQSPTMRRLLRTIVLAMTFNIDCAIIRTIMDRRKLLQYLLLNVLVSATVTGGMLFWYDRNYRSVVQPSVQQSVPGSNNAATTNSPDLQTDIPIEISSVIGAGTLGSEIAIIKFEGEGQLDLASWQLKDEDGNTFTFPELTLYPNGAVQVHTISGTDTVIDLYWGIGESVWSSGENARLFDPQGNLRAVYRVP
jgi:hypothetical protein